MSIMELTSEFKFSKTQSGVTCTRAFAYDPDDLNIGTATIPKIGSVFVLPEGIGNLTDASSNDIMPSRMDKLYCRTQDITTLAGHPGKLLIYCNYTNEPVDTNVFIYSEGDYETPQDPEKLPKTVEYSGEFVSINPSTIGDNNWKWSTGDKTVQQPIPSRVNVSSVRITKYVPAGYFSTLSNNIKSIAGTVNDTASPLGASMGGSKGSWLFIGASSEMFRNHNDVFMWKVDLEFVYRNPNSAGEDDGHQKILSLDHGWDIPKDGSGNKLYQYSDFSKLFNER